MAFGEPRPRKKRARHYGHEVREALWKIWKIFDGPCGQRLQPLLETEVGRLRDLEELKEYKKISLERLGPSRYLPEPTRPQEQS